MANFYKKRQSGRSMIEMLGVLSIIGMLSIGGIAAYTKAMRRHNVNATAEIFNDIIRSYATFRETAKMDKDKYIFTEHLVDFGIYPECKLAPSILWNGDEWGCKTPTGQIAIWAYPSYQANRVNFYVVLTKDTCADFLSYNWHNVIPKDWGYDNLAYPEDGFYISIEVGPDNRVLWNNKNITNYNMAGIAEACDTCKEGEPCQIFFAYGGEV